MSESVLMFRDRWRQQGLEVSLQVSPVRRERCGQRPDGIHRHVPMVDLALEAAGTVRLGRYRAVALIVRTDGMPHHDIVMLPGNAGVDCLPVVGTGHCDACGTGKEHTELVVLDDAGTDDVPLQVGLTCLKPAFGARSRDVIDCLDTLARCLERMLAGRHLFT